MREAVFSNKGAKPKGPYSPAMKVDGPLVFVSGQLPVDPVTGEPKQGTFKDQAEQALINVGSLLEASKTSWENVVKVNVYLSDFKNLSEFNEVYKNFVHEPYPSRTTVQAGMGTFSLEIDCVALVPGQ